MDCPYAQWKTRPLFPLTRGLRKGCPLSPILYAVMIDTLSKQLEKDGQ